jgi:hypothetical protein
MKIRSAACALAGLVSVVPLAGFASGPVAANSFLSVASRPMQAAPAKKIVIAGPVTLKYTASTSDTDSCTGPCAESLALAADYSAYSRTATGTQTATVTFNVTDGKTQQVTGVLSEPSDTYNASGTFTNSPSQCGFLAGSATEVAQGGTVPGTLVVASLKAITGSGGKNDLQLNYSGLWPGENTYWSGTTTPCQIAPYASGEEQSATDASIVDEQWSLYNGIGVCGGYDDCVTINGWTISPDWSLDIGGQLATKMLTATAPEPPSEPGAADTGTIKVTQTWELSTQPCPVPYEPSGPAWARKFPASREIKDLSEPFRGDVTRFIDAMTRAGIHERTISTLRPYERAYLMHYSWLIANDDIDPRDVPAFVPKKGQSPVDICWVHATGPGVPDLAASVKAAEQMVKAFGIDPKNTIPPALDSVHTRGQAIDMTTTWTGERITIREANGHEVTIDTTPHDGINSGLIAVGRSYGVIHLQPASHDPNHWSINGS